MLHRPASHQLSSGSANRVQGLSVLELVVSVAIILIISGFAISPITKTLKTYQLNDAANQLAGILKFTPLRSHPKKYAHQLREFPGHGLRTGEHLVG